MSNEELEAQACQSAPQIRIAAGIWIVGMMIIVAITVIWVVLAVWADDYYSNSKAVRDAAAAVFKHLKLQATREVTCSGDEPFGGPITLGETTQR